MLRATLPVFCTLAWALPAAAENPNPWKEAVNDEGLVINTRDVPGADIREVKAEMVVPVPPARMWAVIADAGKYVEFVPNVVEGKLLSDGPIHHEYFRLDPPLVSERDYTIKVMDTVDATAGTYRRTWNTDNGKGPAVQDGIVRMPLYDGSWTLEPEGTGTRVVYWSMSDPGGSIPKWIANKSTIGTVEDMMRAMHARAVDPNHKR